VTLTFDLFTLKFYKTSIVTCLVCTKFEGNRIIRGWVIDDLAHFGVQFQGVGQNWQSFFMGGWTQLYQTWQGHRAIIAVLSFCFRARISCCIFKRVRLKVEWCSKRRQISHFLTPPVKIRGEVGEISTPIPIIEALPKIEPPEYIWRPSTARLQCWTPSIDKKEKEKKSSWAKLKAFPTNVGRPKYYIKKQLASGAKVLLLQ